MTESQEYAILAYENSSIVTKASGSMKEFIGRQRITPILIIDKQSKFIITHFMIGMLKLFELNPKSMSMIKEHNLRSHELNIVDLKQDRNESNVLWMLYADSVERKFLKRYLLDIRTGLEGGTSVSVNADSKFIVTVNNGVLIIGDSVELYRESKKVKQIYLEKDIQICEQMDESLQKFLLGCLDGSLIFLKIEEDNLSVEHLGFVSTPSSITYLDSGVVFIGSKEGDSQLIRLKDQKDGPNGWIKVLDEFPSCAPIVDFCTIKSNEQDTIVACCGVGKEGSLKIISSGSEVIPSAEIDIPLIGLSNIFTLNGKFDDLVVVSYAESSCVLKIENEDIQETDIQGFQTNVETISCFEYDSTICQITSNGIRLLGVSTISLEGQVVCACKFETSIFISLSESKKVLQFDLDSGKNIRMTRDFCFKEEVSCFDVDKVDGSLVVAAGLWSEFGVEISFGSDSYFIPSPKSLPIRSIKFASLPLKSIFAAVGDGEVCQYALTGKTLTQERCFALGKLPVKLTIVKDNIIASCDRPSILYSNGKKTLLSHLNSGHIKCVAYLNCNAFADHLLVASTSGLFISKIENSKGSRLNVKSIHLGETPRRIVHFTDLVGVASIHGNLSEIKGSSFTLYDTFNYEKICSVPFAVSRVVTCVCALDGFLLGSTLVSTKVDGIDSGNISWFVLNSDRQLEKKNEIDFDHCVYAICAGDDHIFVSTGSKIVILNKQFESIYEQFGFVAAILLKYNNGTLVVGDIMKSVFCFKFKDNKLHSTGHDFHNSYSTAVEIADDFFLSADTNGMLFGGPHDAVYELSLDMMANIGDQINVFHKGTLKHTTDSNLIHDSFIFATVSGSIGCLFRICPDKYILLEKIESKIVSSLKYVGNLDYVDWKKFKRGKIVHSKKQIIDGDLFQQFLQFPLSKQQEICAGVIKLDELLEIVDSFSPNH